MKGNVTELYVKIVSSETRGELLQCVESNCATWEEKRVPCDLCSYMFDSLFVLGQNKLQIFNL